MLADFDFAWLPGTPNQKVLEFEADDPVWGVSSQPDDCYDLFMLAYHLYITYFEARTAQSSRGDGKSGRVTACSWSGSCVRSSPVARWAKRQRTLTHSPPLPTHRSK